MAFQWTYKVEEPGLAIDVIFEKLEQDHAGFSRQKIKQVMQKGAVWLGSGKKPERMRRAKRQLSPGDEIFFYYDEDVLQQQPAEAELVADEKQYSVWYKPPMMFSKGTKYGDHCAITRVVEIKLQRPAFPVHRLDRAASGLMLLAHTKKSAAALSELFRKKTIEKHYRVKVRGEFSSDEVVMEDPLDDKPCRTIATLRHYDEVASVSELDVLIETGRKHQIRRHLSGLGFSVVGDRLYGGDAEKEDLQLQAVSLAFECPFSEKPKCYTLND